MARYTGPKGKIVRKFRENIFGNDKFDRLLNKRPNPPGMHGAMAARRKRSDYAQQLMEKQKIKYTYGLLERQFRVFFKRAQKQEGKTGDNLIVLLERRLDNVIYRAGWAGTRMQARQLVLHGHLKVNGRRVNVPSFIVRKGDVITVKDSERSRKLVERYLEENQSRPKVDWLSVDVDQKSITVAEIPTRENIDLPVNEQLVVELYSK